MRIMCPHCGALSPVRSSEQVTDTLKFVYVQCPDVTCGFVMKVSVEVVEALNQPANPNPRVNLPLSIRARKPEPEKKYRASKTWVPPPDQLLLQI